MRYLRTFESFEGDRGYVMQVISSMCEDQGIDFSLKATSVKGGKETDSIFVFDFEEAPDSDQVEVAVERLDEIGYFARKLNWVHAFHCVVVYRKDCELVDYMDDEFERDLSHRNTMYPEHMVGATHDQSEEVYTRMVEEYEHVVLNNETYFIGDESLSVDLSHGTVVRKDGKYEWIPRTKTRHFATMYKSYGWWRWYSTVDVKDCVEY